MNLCHWVISTVVNAAFLNFLPIGQNHFLEPHDRRAVFRAISADGDLVSRFHDVPGPARANEMVRTGSLGLPVLNFALLVLHVEQNQSVGVDELKIRDSSFQRYHLRHIVVRYSMVREGGTCNRKKKNKLRNQNKCFNFQSSLQKLLSALPSM